VTQQVLELEEYSLTDEVLPFAVAGPLAAGSGGALSLVAASSSGARLQSRQHVGVVTFGDVEVRIRPKVPQANVLGMLAASTGLVSWLEGTPGFGRQESLLASMVALYASELTDLLRGGLQRSYEDHEERLVVMRGRLDIASIVSMGGLPAPVPCRFDEYTPDHLLHRYLVAALDRCAQVRDVGQGTRRLLRHARHSLVDVPSVPLAADAIDRHSFTRLDERYRRAAAMARLVLEHLTIEHQRGVEEVRAFTVDMNRLFEAWVAQRLPTHLDATFTLAAQTTRHLDDERKLTLYPDLEIRSGGRPVYVADTKYKLTDSGLGRITDYYQAHAYATVLGLPEALLIYCQRGSSAVPRTSEVQRSGIRIRTQAMNLSGSYTDLEAQVAQLGRLVAEHARGTRAARPVASVGL
jgi:5-methylcytosine-specific restriction enzyme subunit McrC